MGNPNYTVEAALSFRIDRKSVKEPTECGMAGGLSAPQKNQSSKRGLQCTFTDSLRNMSGWGGGSCQNGSHQRAQITRVQFWLRGTPEDNYVFPSKFMSVLRSPWTAWHVKECRCLSNSAQTQGHSLWHAVPVPPLVTSHGHHSDLCQAAASGGWGLPPLLTDMQISVRFRSVYKVSSATVLWAKRSDCV